MTRTERNRDRWVGSHADCHSPMRGRGWLEGRQPRAGSSRQPGFVLQSIGTGAWGWASADSVQGVKNLRSCHPKQDQSCSGRGTALCLSLCFFTNTKILWLLPLISPNTVESHLTSQLNWSSFTLLDFYFLLESIGHLVSRWQRFAVSW